MKRIIAMKELGNTRTQHKTISNMNNYHDDVDYDEDEEKEKRGFKYNDKSTCSKSNRNYCITHYRIILFLGERTYKLIYVYRRRKTLALYICSDWPCSFECFYDLIRNM